MELADATLARLQEQGLLLAYASELGFIDDMADLTRRDLETVGIPSRLMELNEIDNSALARESVMLFLTSTTGSGDAPFAADQFCSEIMAAPVELAHLHFGLLSAGDTDYDEFCGFGLALRDWLLASGAQPLFAPVDIDCEEDAAIRHWRQLVRLTFARKPAHA